MRLTEDDIQKDPWTWTQLNENYATEAQREKKIGKKNIGKKKTR